LSQQWAANLVALDAVADNDVLIKGAAYGFLIELVEAVVSAVESVGILGAARFVVMKRLEKHSGLQDRTAALDHWKLFLERAEALEPTNDEIELSIVIEEMALRQHQPLDSGESQLCAVAIKRELDLVLTGDKRAIAAAENLLPNVAELVVLGQRMMCLEQAAAYLVAKQGAVPTRRSVCAEPHIDLTLRICFECASLRLRPEFYPDGLHSYIEDLRRQAPTLLALGPPNPQRSSTA
jgi:hypothetical protein